ncbi:MAG: protein nirF [Rhodospirillaceae bacterium]|jgi:protein NirF|nr:protein nirF [Rhodospirillaceae bacterium]MBT4939088.1 protein nirF [Rhodospirillaceae bacterium]MBT5940846.1 protein nirF [Rhodospirillaceae bacterium]MBT7266690.1 protein nirF [Rhodospirillaceae bacterium]
MQSKIFIALALLLSACVTSGNGVRGTGDLGVVIERAAGSIKVVETTDRTSLYGLTGFGDLSHASTVFSRDGRFAYIFGRDGGLTKVDLLARKIIKRVMQSGNSIGGAISQDGKLIAVSNYKPGGVKVFNSETLELVADIPATDIGDGKRSKVVGLVDAPGQKFVFSLYDSGEIWLADFSQGNKPLIRKFKDIGTLPYDGLVTPDGRYYIAGLFGEDGLSLLDLWQVDNGVKRILDGYGRGKRKLPVYKMPHLEGWASVGGQLFLPAVGHHEVLVVERGSWKKIDAIPVHGQPIFAVARPDGRQIWVNFAHPRNNVVQVIDVPSRKVIKTLKPGKAVLHLEFTPRGEQVWLSVRDEDRVEVYDTRNFKRLATIKADKPSGIFLTARANRTGL